MAQRMSFTAATLLGFGILAGAGICGAVLGATAGPHPVVGFLIVFGAVMVGMGAWVGVAMIAAVFRLIGGLVSTGSLSKALRRMQGLRRPPGQISLLIVPTLAVLAGGGVAVLFADLLFWTYATVAVLLGVTLYLLARNGYLDALFLELTDNGNVVTSVAQDEAEFRAMRAGLSDSVDADSK